MNEENKFSPKKRWTRIFRKKWFFPSVYLMLAALLISAVFWYQNDGTEETEGIEDVMVDSDGYVPVINDETAEPVMEQEELMQLPVANADEAEIVTKFFDYGADETDRANALIHYNNRYYQSTGIDIAAADGEGFDVVSALSGTVLEVKKDALMGNVVVISHEDDVTTYYASLEEVAVEVQDEVEQGQTIGTAGKNIFGSDNGTHVHFELRKAEAIINPEEFINQPVANMSDPVEEPEEEPEESETEIDTGTDVDSDTDANSDTDADADADAD